MGVWVWGLGFGVYPVDEHDGQPPAPRSSEYGTYKTDKAMYKTVKATYKTVKATYKTVNATYNAVKATYQTVTTRIWPWLSGKRPGNVIWCSLFARKRL